MGYSAAQRENVLGNRIKYEELTTPMSGYETQVVLRLMVGILPQEL
jgi:hypothetical protein